MQMVTPDGLKPAVGEGGRCTIQAILNANSSIVSSLQSMWATKSPQEAYDVLAQPDVTVTNESDKWNQLPKLLALNEMVMRSSASSRSKIDEVAYLTV